MAEGLQARSHHPWASSAEASKHTAKGHQRMEGIKTGKFTKSEVQHKLLHMNITAGGVLIGNKWQQPQTPIDR